VNNLEYINNIRKILNIQLETVEILEILKTLDKPKNFLIFGLGNDSVFWHNQNKGGRTVFIEDNPYYYNSVLAQNSDIEAYLVNYQTQAFQWQDLLNNEESLCLDLDTTITSIKWDVILVDGPNGYNPSTPGRMKSIYMASKLSQKGSHIFVHDCERFIEETYANKYLGEDFFNQVIGRAVLRHYIKN
jgi:uncharacterized protein (TIGR01627 family)